MKRSDSDLDKALTLGLIDRQDYGTFLVGYGIGRLDAVVRAPG